MATKIPCDTRRCRKEGIHKMGMFHFCEDHYKELTKKLCKHTGLERLPSGNGLTLTTCCHQDSGLAVICEIENQKKCQGYEEE